MSGGERECNANDNSKHDTHVNLLSPQVNNNKQQQLGCELVTHTNCGNNSHL